MVCDWLWQSKSIQVHVENNFLVDLFFQVNPFSEVTFRTSLRKFQYFFILLQVENICFSSYCFRLYANLKSHSKIWCKTEEQVRINWSHNGRISGTYGLLKFKKWTKGKCISTVRWSKFCTGSWRFGRFTRGLFHGIVQSAVYTNNFRGTLAIFLCSQSPLNLSALALGMVQLKWWGASYSWKKCSLG